MKWPSRLYIIMGVVLLCLSAKDIPGTSRNILSFIKSQRKPVTQWLKLLQLCREFIPTLHEAVERIWRKTEDCFEYFWVTRHNWTGYILFKSCQISKAFPPFTFWTKILKSILHRLAVLSRGIWKACIVFPRVSWSFYKYLPARRQKEMHMVLFLQKWLTTSSG